MSSVDEGLAGYLNEINASRDVVQQALRYFLARETDDLPPEEMRELLAAAADDPSQVDVHVAALAQSTGELEEAALTYLSAAWADPAERDRVRAALTAANKSLPVVETVVLATVAMYAMYLLATGGKAKETTTVKRGPDGSYEQTSETIYANPKPWLQNVLGLFRREGSGGGDATT